MYFIFKYISFAVVALFCVVAIFDKKESSKISDNIAVRKFTILFETGIKLLDKYWLVALMGIFAVFLFTRFFALDIVPSGAHVDEIGYWYDAHNLAEYGTDRMGNRYPWLPASYGDGHNPCYAYMCMIMLKIFPFSVKLMRAVMGISAIPCFFASFGITHQLYEDRKIALLGPILVTITPYIFAANRWGLNANQMLYVGTVILYFTVMALKYDKIKYYICMGVFLGISLLTYHLSYIMMPLYFICLFIYLIIVRKFEWKKAFAAFIPFALIGIPTFLEQLVNIGLIKPFYFAGSDYQRLKVYRVGEIAPINFVKNIGNIVTLVFGDNVYNYNSVKEFGTLHWASIPLLMTGLVLGVIVSVKTIRKRELNLFTPILIYTACVYLGFISVIGCNSYKANAIYIAFIVMIIAGFRFVLGYSVADCCCVVNGNPKESGKEAKLGNSSRRFFVVSTLLILALSFLLYTEFYFRRMNSTYGLLALFMSTETGDMVKYEEQTYNPLGDKKVYMELNYENRDYADWMIALYTEMNPTVFTDYDFKKLDTPEEEKNTVVMDHFVFAFPSDFDENEDAVYILGSNWDHISGYLTSIGFNCDTTFQGYKILYK